MTDDGCIAHIPTVLHRVLQDPNTQKTLDYYFGTFQSSVAKVLTYVPVLEYSPRTYLNERIEEAPAPPSRS